MTHCQHFTIADAHFKLSTNAPHIVEHLLHIFGSFHSTEPFHNSPIAFEITQGTDETIHLKSKHQPPKTYCSIDTFIAEFELRLIRSAFSTMTHIGVHAGGVISKGKTILFPGQSGNGKSTLTLGCLLRGDTFLSDEMALIHPDTYQVYPFPRVLCLKNDINIFQSLDHQHLLHKKNIVRPLNNSLCVSPESFDRIPQNQPSPIHRIVFPSYGSQNKTKLTRISPVQSLTKLLSLTFKRTKSPHVLDTLGHIVETTPSYELTMNNLPDALKEVEHLVSE